MNILHYTKSNPHYIPHYHLWRIPEKGVYKGRKSNINVEKIKSLKDEGLGATAIAKTLGIHRDMFTDF